jgi:hypothetical protein
VEGGEAGGIGDVADQASVSGAVDKERPKRLVAPKSLTDNPGRKKGLQGWGHDAGGSQVSGGDGGARWPGVAGAGHAYGSEEHLGDVLGERLPRGDRDCLCEEQIAEI